MSVLKEKNNSKINIRWIIDLSISTHICNNVEYFDALSNGGNLEKLTIENKVHINIKGIERTHLKVLSGAINLFNIVYIFDCVTNIISLGKLVIHE